MGACEFSVVAEGKTARAAFDAAVEHAQYMEGHGGYTGTIAEKSGFKMVTRDVGETGADCAERMMEGPFADKWAPAGCIELGDDKFLFFGWAGS